MTTPEALHGLMAEFDTDQQVLAAVREARQAGYRDMDAYTPYPVKGLAHELGMRRNRVPLVVLIGGIVGAVAGYGMQHWTMAIDYPFDAGGRPLNSWPAFLPVAFEVMVLVASFAALLGMLFLNGLPQPHHPVLKVDRFVEAGSHRFFLCIEATDPRFEPEATRQFLARLSPKGVIEVPN
jgi:hypothetical protein